MGMGIPITIGFPWVSRENRSSFGLLMEMRMEMGITCFTGEK